MNRKTKNSALVLLAAVFCIALALAAVFGFPALHAYAAVNDEGAETSTAAKIGDTEYNSLSDAIDAVENGETVVLTSDLTVTSTMTISMNRTYTIDFNGHTVSTETNNSVLRFNDGDVTLIDSVGTGGVKNTYSEGSASYGIYIGSTSVTLTLGEPVYDDNDAVTEGKNGITISVAFGYAIYNKGNLTVYDVNLSTDGEYGVYSNANSALVIYGGSFTAAAYVVYSRGSGAVYGGTFTETNTKGYTYNIYAYTDAFAIYGGTFIGGDFYGKYGPFIYGGTFSDESAKQYLAENYVLVENADGTYGVAISDEFSLKIELAITEARLYALEKGVDVSEIAEYIENIESADTDEELSDALDKAMEEIDRIASAVAVVGGSYYSTLQEAIDAAESGDTVTLLKNVTKSITIVSETEVTLDLNGYTLTEGSTTEGDSTTYYDTVTVESGATLTVTDSSESGVGKILNDANGQDAKEPIVNNGTVYLYGGTIERSGSWGYAVRNQGNMVIEEKDSSILITNTYADENGNGSPSSLIGNGYTLVSNTTVVYSDCTLTINSGTFTGGYNTVINMHYGVLKINGGTFTNDTQHVILNYNKAEITGGTFTANADGGAAVYNIYSDTDSLNGIVTITGGTFTATGSPIKTGVYMASIYNDGGKVEISGAAVTATGTDVTCGIYGRCGTLSVSGNSVISGYSYGVYSTDDDITIGGNAKITGQYALYAVGSDVTVEGGTFTGYHTNSTRSTYAVYAKTSAQINIAGGTFSGKYVLYSSASSIDVSDGTFTGTLKTASSGTVALSGGAYDTEPDAAYLADGYEAVYVNGKYAVYSVEAEEYSKLLSEAKEEALTEATLYAYRAGVAWDSDWTGKIDGASTFAELSSAESEVKAAIDEATGNSPAIRFKIGAGESDQNDEKGVLYYSLDGGETWTKIGTVVGADGQDGKDGADGVGIASVELATENDKGESGTYLKVAYTNGDVSYIDISSLQGADGQDGADGQKGQDGKDGVDGQDGKDGATPELKMENGELYVSYDGGENWTSLGSVDGGSSGVDTAELVVLIVGGIIIVGLAVAVIMVLRKKKN